MSEGGVFHSITLPFGCGMLLTDLLTLLLVSTTCVTDFTNTTAGSKCQYSSNCCTYDFVNLPPVPKPKLTSQIRVPDHCAPTISLLRGNSTTSTYSSGTQRDRPVKAAAPASKKWRSTIASQPPLNATISNAFDESFLRVNSREEFRKMRRFHFGREVPVIGICLCVIFDCALIALVCVALQVEDDVTTEQEVEMFPSLEGVHESSNLREAQTQTIYERPAKTFAEKSCQTLQPFDKSPEEIRAEKFERTTDTHGQSEC